MTFDAEEEQKRIELGLSEAADAECKQIGKAAQEENLEKILKT